VAGHPDAAYVLAGEAEPQCLVLCAVL
jgi:hypothetical protein